MKKLTFVLISFLCFTYQQSKAQYSKYIIRLTDKSGTPFSISDSEQFLSERSIQRRTQHNIPIDETDLPVSPAYIDSIQQAGNVKSLMFPNG